MSTQIIPLKDRTDLRESSRLPAIETTAAAPGIRSSGLGSAGFFSKRAAANPPAAGPDNALMHELSHRVGDARSPAKSPPTPNGTIYTCPMHPQIRQVGPGFCPICGMALEPEL